MLVCALALVGCSDDGPGDGDDTASLDAVKDSVGADTSSDMDTEQDSETSPPEDTSPALDTTPADDTEPNDTTQEDTALEPDTSEPEVIEVEGDTEALVDCDQVCAGEGLVCSEHEQGIGVMAGGVLIYGDWASYVLCDEAPEATEYDILTGEDVPISSQTCFCIAAQP